MSTDGGDLTGTSSEASSPADCFDDLIVSSRARFSVVKCL